MGILLGLASDILFAALSALILCILAFKRWLIPLAFGVLIFFLAANYEHIKYNSSHVSLSTLENALSITFVTGQLTNELVFILNVLGLAGVFSWYLMRIGWLRSLGAALALPICAIALLMPIKFSYFAPEWLQTHPLLPRAADVAIGSDYRGFSGVVSIIPPQLESTLPRHNVLLVYLEGLSPKSMQNGDMGSLSRLANDNIYFSRYFGNQVITVNGLYSSLTGDFPYFYSKSLKWNDVTATSEVALNAVPARMNAAGYQTSFLQSAPLWYMNKEPILRHLGFTNVKGGEAWDKSYSEDSWGIDDLALFEHTLEYIDGISPDSPWFVSVLTTGTHSPYNVPIDFKPELPDDRYRALSYLDMAIEQLMLGLAERGLLDNTVVILTSDESSERSFENPLQDSIHLNWLPLVIVHPSKRQETIDNFIGAHRLSEILQAVIGDLNTSTLRALGQEAEPLIFGNAYSNKLFWFDPKAEELLFCNIADYHCAAFDNVPDPLALTERQPDRIRYFPMLREMIRALVEL
jgi:hypothetical protein